MVHRQFRTCRWHKQIIKERMEVKYGKHLQALILSGLAAAVVSCSEQTQTMDDMHSAMTFHAESTQLSKVTSDGKWSGKERIAVKIGSEVKEYHATTMSGSSATIEGVSAEQTHWWQNTSDVSVMAWMVGNEYHTDLETIGGWTDQSSDDKMAASDFLFVPPTKCSFGTDNYLGFLHQMSKIRIDIKNEGVVKGANPAQVSVSIGDASDKISIWGHLNHFLIKPDMGKYSGLTAREDLPKGYVLPCKVTATSGCISSYEALLIPQDFTGKKMIIVSFNGKNYSYIPETGQPEAIVNGGYSRVYNVVVNNLGLSVSAGNISGWSDGDSTSGTASGTAKN